MEPEPVRPEVLDQTRGLPRHKRLLVGLNVSKLLYMGGYTRSNMFGLREEYPALVKHLISFLIERDRGYCAPGAARVWWPGKRRERSHTESPVACRVATQIRRTCRLP